MGMTMIEKTLAAASEESTVKPDDVIFPNIDLVTATDVTLPGASQVLDEVGIQKIFDPNKVSITLDSYSLSNSTGLIALADRAKKFADQHGIEKVHKSGRGGVSHITNILDGLAVPGDLIIASDSHGAAYGGIGALGYRVGATDLAVALSLGQLWITVPETIRVTFTGELDQLITGKDLGLLLQREIPSEDILNRAVEFAGEPLLDLSVPDRLVLSDMAAEAGAVTAMIPPNEIILQYLADRSQKEAKYHFADDDAEYAGDFEISLEHAQSLLQDINKPERIFAASALSDEKPVQTVVLGGCGGGQIEDFSLAAQVMKYRHVHEDVRLIIIPATDETFQQMVNQGLASIFAELGASIWPPTCAFCPDSALEMLAENGLAVITGKGAPGLTSAEVYSASVPVAAASAVNGYITDPKALVDEPEPSLT
ncbi:MAG: hypothetical protein GF372_08100 [Candidatus Marinimicrobia bacterium]|nr:hypothetical protein [Candidatus Neomarinimicrobiota bacterium]